LKKFQGDTQKVGPKLWPSSLQMMRFFWYF